MGFGVDAGREYHVLNRGNYRSDIFRAEKTKRAFLQCLGEACEKTGWRVHAWCIMSNHYHVALETPGANLVEGMRWLQGTFATRFNRFRRESGHLFQGRYKALIVDRGEGLGPLCHYIHLNPVRARLRTVEQLPGWAWSSLSWLMQPKLRPAWFDPLPALNHAGALPDTAAGRRKYVEYLDWLAEDEPARKAMRFATMSTGWVIGSRQFKKELAAEHRKVAAHAPAILAELLEARDAAWNELVDDLLKRLSKTRADLEAEGKSVDWKLALAATMKGKATVTNRWLAEHLGMGNMYEVSRKVARWLVAPDASLMKKLE